MYSYIIVDDEFLIRKGIRSKIESFGEELGLCCIGEANNGREALALIAECDPDIIVTDMRMPGIDGRELLSMLKQDYKDKQMIVISGYKDYEYMLGAIEAQVTGYLLKPFSREEVRTVMEKAISAIQAIARSRNMQIQLDDMQAEQERLYEKADLEACRKLIETGRWNGYGAIGAAEEKGTFFLSAKGQKLQTMGAFMLYVLYWSKKAKGRLSGYEDAAKQIEIKLCEAWGEKQSVLAVRSKNEALLYIVLPLERSDDIEHLQMLTGAIKDTITGLAKAEDGATKTIAAAAEDGDGGITLQAEALVDMDHAEQIEAKWLLGACAPKYGWEQLHEAYLECRAVMEACLAHAKSNYYVYKKSAMAGCTAKEQQWEELDKLVYLLESGHAEQAWTHLDNHLFQSNPTWGEVKQRCRQLIKALERMADLGLLALDTDWEKQVERLADIYDRQAMIESMKELIAAAKLINATKHADSSQQTVLNIKSYIEQHYHEDLTLKKLSDRFYLNSSYCSYIFKEKTGVTITEFILANRMAKAKELLQRTDYPMDRIARLVGYSNEKYFYRIFKKAEGLTPQAYRQSAR